MKKVISVLLTLSILFTLLAVCANAADAQLGFAVASDLHYCLPSQELEKTNDDPIFWYANRRTSMDNESGFIIDEFLAQCASDSTCEYVLISGDLTDSGRNTVEEHYAVAEKLKRFEASCGKQVFVINGNHDTAGDGTGVDEFKRIYSDLGYERALTVDSESCSYTADLGAKYRLIALDSCSLEKSTADGVTLKKLAWVKQQADKAKADGRYPILMMHHNLLEHMPFQVILSANFIVKNHVALAEYFAGMGIKLVFTGHEHCSDATSYTSASGKIIYDFATTALTMYPLQYRSFIINDNEISYTAKTVDSIDTQALSSGTKGYTEEQLSLMGEGLNAYSLGFFKAGLQYRLELSLSPEKLGISEDDIYYELVMRAVNTLTDTLRMPFYGENSVSELAGRYGIELPESSYKNGWELVGRLAAMHYEGEEAFAPDSTEITLLLRTAALIIREEFAGVNELTLSGAGDAINAYFASLGCENMLMPGITAGEYFIAAVASPLLYGFANDDAVSDNNGTLPGYGTVNAESNAQNVKVRITEFFEKLVMYFKMVFRIWSLHI